MQRMRVVALDCHRPCTCADAAEVIPHHRNRDVGITTMAAAVLGTLIKRFKILLAHVALLARGVCLITPWLLWLLCADLSLSLLATLKPILPTVAYHLSSAIAWTVWLWIQHVFVTINGASIKLSVSSELVSGESAIVISNHRSWTDFYLIQAAAIEARMLGNCRWFAKKQLKWVPFLGWSVLLENVFLSAVLIL